MALHNLTPPSLSRIVSTVAKFDDEVFKLVAELISGPTSTDLSEEDLSRLSRRTGVSEEDLGYFLSLISFLFVQTDGVEKQERLSAIGNFVEDVSEIDDPGSLANKLATLIENREAYDAAVKQNRLSRGFLPYLLEASSFVDLRTDFERDSKGELTGRKNSSIPVVQLMLVTDAFDESDRHVILQLDKSSIKKLKKAIQDVEVKIEILEN